eukprot:TRINITY_DN9893_c0_g2_i2.p2 TRINITY_DN9893_c0_g2~~TRINITY_DN9893_c0_g2_i2.p2  ORF type:complete len:122 (-),score=7.11 TRINITY_DN9893_c0_g2_i2:544-909(-)
MKNDNNLQKKQTLSKDNLCKKWTTQKFIISISKRQEKNALKYSQKHQQKLHFFKRTKKDTVKIRVQNLKKDVFIKIVIDYFQQKIHDSIHLKINAARKKQIDIFTKILFKIYFQTLLIVKL